MIEKIEWLQSNALVMVQIVTLLVVAAELVTRLTPTKTDDGFVKRLGSQLDKLLTALKVPNLRQKIREGSDLNVGSDSQVVSDDSRDLGVRLPVGTPKPTDRGE